ncbi:hypothetical protein FFF34_015735 [Inquilinus sp. KBS0705]|nr:hypothetical protein FFF34_015735 [Inquilinus sp. KBS0705]
MRKYLGGICILLLLWGCKKDPVIVPPDPVVKADLEFKLEAAKNPGKVPSDVVLNIDGSAVKGDVPSFQNNHSFVLSFSFKDAASVVKVGDAVQQSGVTQNDFTKPVKYTVTDSKGAVKTFTVSIYNFTGLPIFYINTASPVVSKDDYVDGSLSINPNVDLDQDSSAMVMQIKGRGNSTWGMPKKPYKIKLDKKASIFGLTAAKSWVLLANYSDKTLMRNYLAYNLSQQLKGDFTPHGIFVEVIMNGQYAGNYLLCEQVEIKPGRVDITELKASDVSGDAITGGYLVELDQRKDAEFMFSTAGNLPFSIKEPEDIVPVQLDYIHNYMQQTENAILAADFANPTTGYAKYINTDSFINWFLVNELFKNQDAANFSSMYYYKDRGGKLGMGPAWDFDLGAGNVDYSDATKPEGWWVRDGLWFSHLFEDPAFKAKVRARWDHMKANELPAMHKSITDTKAYLTESANENFRAWDILGVYVWPNPVVLGTYPKEVDYMDNWFKQREAWIDANL